MKPLGDLQSSFGTISERFRDNSVTMRPLGSLVKPLKPYKVLGRSLKPVRDDLGTNSEKKRYDEAPGGPYKALGGLVRPLGSL